MFGVVERYGRRVAHSHVLSAKMKRIYWAEKRSSLHRLTTVLSLETAAWICTWNTARSSGSERAHGLNKRFLRSRNRLNVVMHVRGDRGFVFVGRTLTSSSIVFLSFQRRGVFRL